MDREILNRFIELRKKYGPTQRKFGKLLGLSDGSVSRIESGTIVINEKHIKLISGTLGINEEWFKTGKGSMSIDAVPPEEKQLIEAFRKLSPQGRRLSLSFLDDLIEAEIEYEKKMAADEQKFKAMRLKN